MKETSLIITIALVFAATVAFGLFAVAGIAAEIFSRTKRIYKRLLK